MELIPRLQLHRQEYERRDFVGENSNLCAVPGSKCDHRSTVLDFSKTDRANTLIFSFYPTQSVPSRKCLGTFN